MYDITKLSHKEINNAILLGGTLSDVVKQLNCGKLAVIWLLLYIIDNNIDHNLTSNIKDYYSKCYEAAKKYQTLKEFRENESNCYKISQYCKWIDAFTWLKKCSRQKIYSTQSMYNKCLEKAKKCTSLKEFRKTYASSYNKSRKEGWLKEFTWLTSYTADKTKRIWSVYVYEINNTHVYVGLTYDLHRRHLEHCRASTNDTLYQCCTLLNVEIPKYKIIKSNLTGEEAQILEDATKLQYLKSGKWTVINKGKTGNGSGSLGCSSRKWTKLTCFEAAKQCTTRNMFKTCFPRAYNIAIKNKWIEDYDWLPKFLYNLNSTKVNCRAVIQYSKEGVQLNIYKSIQEAKNNLGITSRSSAINDVCRGRKKYAYGYIWKYQDSI